jgi:hypothetical protein
VARGHGALAQLGERRLCKPEVAGPIPAGSMPRTAGPPMDESLFWSIVEDARDASRGDLGRQTELVARRLEQLPAVEIAEFDRIWTELHDRAYTWDLWGAAWILLDGASDDAFDFFRCWLIGQGREVYEGAVHDPDKLADLLADFDDEVDGDGEELGYAADEAYEQLTGVVAPDLGIAPQTAEPAGTPFDFDDDAALAQRFPRLWERFGNL